MCLWLLGNNVNSSSSKHLRRCVLIVPTSKRFPISANPFKMSTAKATANTLQTTPSGCCCTLGRIIPNTLSLQWARSQICFINPAYMDRCESESHTWFYMTKIRNNLKWISNTGITWSYSIALLKRVIRNISILGFKSLGRFSIFIYIFIDRNFRIDSDSWSIYIKSFGIYI